MTTNSTKSYKAPDGFYKSYSFDNTGKVFADGKELSGIQLDVAGLKPAETPRATGMAGMATGMRLGNTPQENPFASYGGSINRLSVDEKGNVYAEIGSPNTPALGATGQNTKGPNGLPNALRMRDQVSDNPIAGLNSMHSQSTAQKVKLSGIALDPARTSRNSGGALGDNNAYLRQEQDGLYFAQVNQGDNPVAYAYSAFQQAAAPTGGPAQPTTARKKGGNAGGGVSADSAGITLLGS